MESSVSLGSFIYISPRAMSVSQLQKPHSKIPYCYMASSRTVESCVNERNEQVQQGQWLRAAILGANDGLLSTTSLMLGVGAAKEDRWSMVVSGLAGALAGACSMAVGEFVSVSIQRDIEKASATRYGEYHEHVIKLDITATPTKLGERDSDLAMPNAQTPSTIVFCENKSPDMVPQSRLSQNFSPGRSPMMKVIMEDSNKTNTTKITSKNAPTNTMELWEKNVLPNPLKAATASALAFLCGSIVPLLPAIVVAPYITRIVVIAIVTSTALTLFGGFGAHLGGSPIRISAVRVLVGGWIAMGVTYALLKPFDADRKGS